MSKENVVREKSFAFSIRIIRMYQHLEKSHKYFSLTKQVLRSGTSIGANIEEAIGGQSRADFLSKLNIAYKECRETSYWLKLLKETDYLKTKQFDSLYSDCDEIAKILYSIIHSTK